MAITPAIAAVAAAGIGAAGSIISGNEQASAAKSAANTQMKMYQQTRSDLLPYMQGGNAAFSSLQGLLGLNGNSASMLNNLRNYPGYQFALDQGVQALDRSAASRGLLLSGGQLKDVTNYGQGMADQLFGTYYGQLSGLASLGENAAAQTGNAGTQAAANAGQAIYAGGTAAASGITGAANNIGGLLQNQNFLSLFNSPASDGSVFGSAQGAADLGAYAMSDRRVKTDIEPVGRTDSGLPIYVYRFKNSNLPQMGVMAQDVEQVAPHAVRTDQRGIKHVNYRAVSQLPRLERKAA